MSEPRFLSNESISTLRRLIGVSIHTIFAPTLDAAGAHLAAWKLSMLISKDNFVNFSCEWAETPRFMNDSWLITVSESSDPIGIERNESGALVSPCTISMYYAKPIRKIEIFDYSYSENDEDQEESVHYDQAILFNCEEKRSFCIACMLNGPGIAEYLHFSEDNRVIQEMLSESNRRLVLE
jgi:hypothetical protein